MYFSRDRFNAGISASDTVSFSLLSFGFVTTISVVLAFGTVTAFPFARGLHWLLDQRALHRWRRGTTPGGELPLLFSSPIRQEWRDGMKIYFWVGYLLFCAFIFGFFYARSDARFSILLMLAIGFIPGFLVFGRQVRVYPVLPRGWQTLSSFDAWMERIPLSIRQIIITSITTIGLISIGIAVFQDLSMQLIGYRKHDVSVRLSKEDFLVLTERATRAGYTINACCVFRRT